MERTLRLKLLVQSVKYVVGQDGLKQSEEIEASAVYGEAGSPNRQWSKWTPAARLTMTISNTEAFDALRPGQYLFVDLSETTKESI